MTATVAADLRAIEGLAAGLGERAVDLAHNNVKGDA